MTKKFLSFRLLREIAEIDAKEEYTFISIDADRRSISSEAVRASHAFVT